MILRLALLGLFTAGLVQAETFRDASEQTHPLDPHGIVRIDNTNGAITIKTWDRPEVSIQVEKRASSEDYLKEIQVEIDSDPHSLSIKTILPHHLLSWIWNWGGSQGEVRLELTVPATVDLNDIHSVNGAVTIDGVHGAVEAHTVNGAINVMGARDNAELSTVNGAIHAEVTAFGPSGHLHFSTINGAVTILVPKEANATIDFSTINGSTSCQLPINLTEESRHGSLEGVIGAGGGSIHASTINGSVRLQAL
jgi:hypothetical protein